MQIDCANIGKIVEEVLRTKLNKNNVSLYQLFDKSLKKINRKPNLLFSNTLNVQLGFNEYKKRNSLGLSLKNLRDFRTSSILEEFMLFICSLYIVHKKIKTEDLRHKLLNIVFKFLNGEPQSLGPFKTELDAYIHFTRLGFDVNFIELDRLEDPRYDIRISKDGISLPVECKYINEFAGSPIYKEAAEEFILLLSNSKIIPNDIKCSIIEYKFDYILIPEKNNKTHTGEIKPSSLYELYDKERISFKSIPEKLISSCELQMICETYNWLNEKHPLSTIVFPLSISEGNHFYVLTTTVESNIKQIIKTRIEKAIKQINNSNVPSIVVLQISEMGWEYFENEGIQTILTNISNEVLLGSDLNVALFFRGKHSFEKNNVAPLFSIFSKSFPAAIRDYLKSVG